MKFIWINIYQKIEYAQAEHFEGDANVSVIVEPVENVRAKAIHEKILKSSRFKFKKKTSLLFSHRVLFLDRLEHVYFQLGRFSVLVNVFYYFQRKFIPIPANIYIHYSS